MSSTNEPWPDHSHFDRAEYQRRIDTLKRRAEAAGIDVILCPDPSSIYWLTGYDGWSFYVPQLAGISRADDLPFIIVREMDIATALATSWLPEAQISGYPESLVQVDEAHPYDFAARQLNTFGHGRARIGIDFDAFYLSPRALAALQSGLPNAKIVDVGRLTNWARTTKSDAEIAVMKKAGEISKLAMDKAIDAIHAGASQTEVAGMIADMQFRGHGDATGTVGSYPAITTLMPSGSAAPHVTPHNGGFADNASTFVELSGVVHRYHAPMTRTVYRGNPPDDFRRCIEVATEGMAAITDAMKEGAIAGDVWDEWRRVAEKQIDLTPQRIGYSVGIGYPPDWGEHTVSIRPNEQTALERNQTVHVMLGIYSNGNRLAASETMLVGKDRGLKIR